MKAPGSSSRGGAAGRNGRRGRRKSPRSAGERGGRQAREPRETPEKGNRLAAGRFDLLVVFLSALGIRLAVWLQIRSLPLVRSPRLDSLEYLEWARRIASGDFSWPAPPPHGPGYPYFLGLVLALSGGSLAAAAVVQSIVGAAGCVLVGLLARRFFGRPAGLVAGLLLAFDGVVAFVDVSLFSEGVLLVLLAAALLAVGRADVSLGRAVAAGALIGLAALVRPTALFLLPVAATVFFLRSGKSARRRGSMPALLACAAAAGVILPVTLANLRATGAPLLVQGHGGFNLWIGNSPQRDGLPSLRPDAGWDRLEGEAARAGQVSAAQQDRYFVRKTLAEIRARPFRWLRLLGEKLVWTLQAEEVRDPFSFAFFRSEASFLRYLPGFGVLFPLALLGGVTAARIRPRPWLLYGAAAAAIASCVLLVTSFRYRLPLVPLLAIFAGSGLVEIFRRCRARAAAWIFPAAVLVIGAAVTRIERHPPSRNFAEEWTATGFALNHERDLDGAERAFRAALAADPEWSAAQAGLGVVAANRGDLSAARSFLAKAAALEPNSVLANLELARLSAREQRWEESEREYRRVLDVTPGEAVALEGLGEALLAERRPADAEEALRRAASIAPASATARRLLARALGAQRRWSDAIDEATRACELDPWSGDSWLTLAMLRIDGGIPREALDALDRAQRTGADPRLVGVGRARSLAALGDRAGAMRSLEDVLRLDPSSVPARRFLQQLDSATRR